MKRPESMSVYSPRQVKHPVVGLLMKHASIVFGLKSACQRKLTMVSRWIGQSYAYLVLW
jgi:hypothetical protein